VSEAGEATLRLVRLRDDAVLPSAAYTGDAGLDLVAAEAAVLEPGGRAVVGCGIAVELPAGCCGLVLPRSGLAARHGVTVLNAPGLIDAGYRGELRVVLHNSDRHEPFVVEAGMRIAQLVVVALPRLATLVVDELPASERGERGFGSSGLVAGHPAR
jgi:dUTP pyrophosphatase